MIVIAILSFLGVVLLLELLRLRALRRRIREGYERAAYVTQRTMSPLPDEYEMLGDTPAPCHGLERWAMPGRAPHGWRSVMTQDQPSGDHVVEVCDVCGAVRRRRFKKEAG